VTNLRQWDKGPAVFGTLPSIDGYLVIANDTGREVQVCDNLSEATGVAEHLNAIAKNGPKALAIALKAEDPPF
jgi:hypothetical protein